MMRTGIKPIVVGLLLVAFASASGAAPSNQRAFQEAVAPFFQAHCLKCHGPEKQKGGLSLHELTGEVTGEEGETWQDILDMLALGEMPPEEEPQPDSREAGRVADWIRAELTKSGATLQDKRDHPAFGNYVDHDRLFNQPPEGVPRPPRRLWRLRPRSYDSALQRLAKGPYPEPFTLNTSSGDSGTMPISISSTPGASGSFWPMPGPLRCV